MSMWSDDVIGLVCTEARLSGTCQEGCEVGRGPVRKAARLSGTCQVGCQAVRRHVGRAARLPGGPRGQIARAACARNCHAGISEGDQRHLSGNLGGVASIV